MNSSLPLHLQEIIFSTSDVETSRKLSKLEKDGKLRKLATRVYTGNLHEEPETIVRRNLFSILGHLYPGILLSHRSALEFKPTTTGQLFLTYPYKRKIHLPGVTLNLIEGTTAIEGDNPLTQGIYASQQARAFLENLEQSRKPGPDSKTLTIPEIEERLEQIIRVKGEAGLNEIRDQARQLAGILKMEDEFLKLNKLIGALLSTNKGYQLSSSLALARMTGQPYDKARIDLFDKLYYELNQYTFQSFPEQNFSAKAFRNFAFFEAYFSNYIEGTEFEIDEAKRIIETDTPLPSRDEDSHDILGTYKLLSNPMEMALTPETPEKLVNILQYRHSVLLSARASKRPGEFKHINNRAGNTDFVDHKLVNGTLIKGFDRYDSLRDPFSKAIFMQFLVSETHPFLDGNGRIARVMMNAELVKSGQTRIIIPTVFREDYLGAVRQLSRQEKPGAYVRMFSRAQQFSATILGQDMNEMQGKLEASNAFLEPDQGKLQILPAAPNAGENNKEEYRRGPKR